MEITTNNTGTQTPPRPNDAKALSEVLGAVAYMLENGQIKHGSPALVNILSAVEDYDSNDMATFRQSLAGHLHEDRVNHKAQIEAYELWEENEKAREYKDVFGNLSGHVTPLFTLSSDKPDWLGVADEAFGEPSALSDEEDYHDVVLSKSQKQFMYDALEVWRSGKQDTMTVAEETEFYRLLEQMA